MMSEIIYGKASFPKRLISNQIIDYEVFVLWGGVHKRHICCLLAIILFLLSGSGLSASPVPDSLSQESQRLKSEYRVGTNLLYDVATVANLHFEVGFAYRMAVNLSVDFSPWDIRKPDIKLRTLMIQPEVRRYFADNFKGHYVGVEGHLGWYNVAPGGKIRYQDKDGNTPLWGAGLSYGYVLPFSEHWGMDFGISVGYARLVYDCFYNLENGIRFTTDSRNWWGPTRAGISIYYQF